MRSVLRPLVLAVLALALAGVPAASASGGALAPDADAVASPAGGLEAGEALPAGPSPSAPAPTGGQRAEAASRARIVAADVPFGPLIAVSARRAGIPVALFTALVWQESGFNPKARSRTGARGLTQLMPATARQLGVRHIYDPAENLAAGALYLRAQLARFRSEALALAAYNAGPGAVFRHKGVPPFAETQVYVQRVLAIKAALVAAGVS